MDKKEKEAVDRLYKSLMAFGGSFRRFTTAIEHTAEAAKKFYKDMDLLTEEGK